MTNTKMILRKHKLVKYFCFVVLLLIIVVPISFLNTHIKNLNTSWERTAINHNDGKLYLCPLFMGRLGNTMFQFAAAYGIASQKKLRVLVPKDSLIAKTFVVDGDVIENAMHICSTFPSYHAHDSEWGVYNQPFSDEIPTKYSASIRGYFQSYKYFIHVKDSIRTQFNTFHKQTRSKASAKIQEIKAYFLAKLNVTNITVIGVHVRRGDKMSNTEVELGSKVAPKEYLIQAMNYFCSKYRTSVFVALGENSTWARETVPSKTNVVFLNPSSSPDIDLAILAMCDHMIMTIGSYGWWAAFLNVGEIVYYKDWIKPGSYLYKGYKHEDYFPHEWNPM